VAAPCRSRLSGQFHPAPLDRNAKALVIGHRLDVSEPLNASSRCATYWVGVQHARSHRLDRVQPDGKTEFAKRKPLTYGSLKFVRRCKRIKASGCVDQHTVKRVPDLATTVYREANDRREIEKHATDAKGIHRGP
jgi:hypothetical protein